MGLHLFPANRSAKDLDDPPKIARLKQWCEDINRVQNEVLYDFLYVDEDGYHNYRPKSFAALMNGFREYKT